MGRSLCYEILGSADRKKKEKKKDMTGLKAQILKKKKVLLDDIYPMKVTQRIRNCFSRMTEEVQQT